LEKPADSFILSADFTSEKHANLGRSASIHIHLQTLNPISKPAKGWKLEKPKIWRPRHFLSKRILKKTKKTLLNQRY